MKWLEVCVAAAGGTDELCDLLTGLGVLGLVIEDENDLDDFIANGRKYWDYIDEDFIAARRGVHLVKFYLSDDDDGRARLEELMPDLAGYTVQTRTVCDEDWENNWKQYYHATDIGERLVIVPQWEQAPGGTERVPVRMNPGLIFGTGSHPSTRMCLEQLQQYAPRRVLDLGCGSGILAIASLLLGAEYALGCDIDEKAPGVAGENAALNGIAGERFRVCCGDVLSDRRLRAEIGGEGFDLIFANIVADVIIALVNDAAGWLAPGGNFVCSGIIDGREDEVRAAIQTAGMRVTAHRHVDNWHCFAACRGGEEAQA